MVKKRIFIGIAAATLLLLAAGAGAANAVSYVNGGITRATVTYTAGSSHTLNVSDTYSDGWGSYSDFAVPSTGASGKVVNTSGAGTTVHSGYVSGGGSIIYDACSKNGSVNIGCSSATSSGIN